MLNTVHYTLRTTSMTGQQVNASVSYDVRFDRSRGVDYNVELHAPVSEASAELQLAWRARIVNLNDGHRYEYDYLKRIYYHTGQTVKVESALTNLQEDLASFLQSSKATPVGALTIAGKSYPGKKLNTLTIWYDPARMLPMRRENEERGNRISDEFVYQAIDLPLMGDCFYLPKPADAVADFNLYPEPEYLPRFEFVPDANSPRDGVYVETLMEEIRRFVILNQWEYGPFATLKLPWLTKMPVTIYRAQSEAVFPPLIVVVEAHGQGQTYFSVSYDFLGYVVAGFTQNPLDLSGYNRLAISTFLYLEELAPLYQAPSYEKEFVIHGFVNSVQSNDFFINAFDMGDKNFDLIIKNFSFHENEGYLILNVYGKEYWDNANIESMFNFIITGQMADAHTTPIIIYAINSLKRLGIYRKIKMPVYPDMPVEAPVAGA